MPSLDSGILLSSRFYETIIDKADSEIALKTPQKLVACGVVSIYGVYIKGLNQKASGLSVFWISFRFICFRIGGVTAIKYRV
jgi:hypothetical protein